MFVLFLDLFFTESKEQRIHAYTLTYIYIQISRKQTTIKQITNHRHSCNKNKKKKLGTVCSESKTPIFNLQSFIINLEGNPREKKMNAHLYTFLYTIQLKVDN